MNWIQVLLDIDQVAVQFGFWISVMFPVVTALYWPWWQSGWGRNIVSLELAIALALLAPTLQLEFGLNAGHTPGHFLLWISVVSLCAVPVIIAWRAVMVYLVQRRGSREDPGPG